MSHQVLARKWRPRSFAELVGQEHVVRALGNALAQGRLHHAYLLTGTRGVGKTTLARILARCLNCERGVGASPCGECSACQQIEAGRFVDLIEIDAASYTGVDNMREVIDNAQYAPTAGRFKVYIIDEVHMLSRNAFNAMLKTLEEPPAHVVFVLATTDPQRVPVTVLSRCLQFNLKKLPAVRIAGHLQQVLDSEGVRHDGGALNLLARAAAGSMRDALSLADQAIAHGGGEVLEPATRDMLGSVERAYLFPLLDALADADGGRLMREAEAIAGRGLSFDAALQDLALLLQQVALAQVLPEAIADEEPERARLSALADRLDPESVQLYYQIALLGRRDLEWAPDEFAGFGMTLLRMLAFVPTAVAPPAAGRVRAPASAPPAAADDGGARAGAPTGFDGDWFSLVQRLSGGAKELASACELVEWSPQRLRLRLPEERRSLLGGFSEKLRGALAELLDPAPRLDVELGRTSGAAPGEVNARRRAERQAAAEAAVYDDPFVQTLIRDFDATVSNIKPIGEQTR